VWVTLDTAEQVARISGVVTLAARAPTTRLIKKPKKTVGAQKRKAKVTFRFTGSAGATFQCRIDKRAWKPCASPKSYRLTAGAHRFRVRAVTGLEKDTSPATWRFRIKRA
jgi:hypothetical protein